MPEVPVWLLVIVTLLSNGTQDTSIQKFDRQSDCIVAERMVKADKNKTADCKPGTETKASQQRTMQPRR